MLFDGVYSYRELDGNFAVAPAAHEKRRYFYLALGKTGRLRTPDHGAPMICVRDSVAREDRENGGQAARHRKAGGSAGHEEAPVDG